MSPRQEFQVAKLHIHDVKVEHIVYAIYCLTQKNKTYCGMKAQPLILTMHTILNEPYSLLVRVSCFISYSVHARFSSVLPIDCKWCWVVGIFELLIFQCFV